MNHRLQKKCLVASVGFHLLLVAILFVGPAFLSSSEKSAPNPPIDIIPQRTIDEALFNPGGPSARQPATQPQLQAQPIAQPSPRVQPRAPDPAPQTKPEPRKLVEPSKAAERDPYVVSAKPVAKKLPNVSLTKVTRPQNNAKSKDKPSEDSSNDETAANDRATRIAKAFSAAAKNVREGISGATTVELGGQGGGSGVSYANFYDAVKKIYWDAWIAPDGAADKDASVEASVTIARNGDVVSTRITRRSGNTLVDQSVQATLDRVRHAVPLPEDTKEKQRIVPIKFNARATRGDG